MGTLSLRVQKQLRDTIEKKIVPFCALEQKNKSKYFMYKNFFKYLLLDILYHT